MGLGTLAEEGSTAPVPQVYDLVLQAVGRTPNGKKIAADKADVAVTDRTMHPVELFGEDWQEWGGSAGVMASIDTVGDDSSWQR